MTTQQFFLSLISRTPRLSVLEGVKSNASDGRVFQLLTLNLPEQIEAEFRAAESEARLVDLLKQLPAPTTV